MYRSLTLYDGQWSFVRFTANAVLLKIQYSSDRGWCEFWLPLSNIMVGESTFGNGHRRLTLYVRDFLYNNTMSIPQGIQNYSVTLRRWTFNQAGVLPATKVHLVKVVDIRSI